MSAVEPAYRCDGCREAAKVEHLDDGPPAGWYQLCRLGEQHTWESKDEWHFCTKRCLASWLGLKWWTDD